MAEETLSVVTAEGPRPFMRGILVQSLVSRGVPFDVAFATATQIRDRLEPEKQVGTAEIARLIDALLSDRYDLERPPVQFGVEPPRVRETDRSSSPFSKGILAVSLQGAGLEVSEAYDVARELEAHLLQEGRKEIDRNVLRDLAFETIERAHGSAAGERYRVWRRALADARPIFILLGGSTGVGKTSIAVEVARRLEISRVIGTDSIRQIMRLMFSSDLMPEIHGSTFDTYRRSQFEPDPLVGRPSPGRYDAIAGFREQAQKIAVGVRALLERGLEENTSMIVEGVNLLPSQLDLRDFEDRAHVTFLVIATVDADTLTQRFATRAAKARGRQSERYLQSLDQIRAIQSHILSEADHHGLQIIDNKQFDDAVCSVIRSVIAKLKESVGSPGEGARS
ncbi:MAG: hypothetical protein HRU00_08080 [Myxococcales bacterium]|nr:hypothetical protein [Myxococcales bacterium]